MLGGTIFFPPFIPPLIVVNVHNIKFTMLIIFKLKFIALIEWLKTSPDTLAKLGAQPLPFPGMDSERGVGAGGRGRDPLSSGTSPTGSRTPSPSAGELLPLCPGTPFPPDLGTTLPSLFLQGSPRSRGLF